MRLAHQPTNSTPPAIINFAKPGKTTRPSKPALADHIDALNAAVAMVEKWCTIEDELRVAFEKVKPSAPKVLGGTTRAQKIVTEGKPDIDLEPADWFYRSREEIEKEHARKIAAAKPGKERAAIKARTAELLADFDAQTKAYAAAEPKELRAAKRKVSKAHDDWSRAEQAIVNYKPTSLSEAIALLDFAGRDGMRGVYFQVGEGDLKQVMRNAAAAIRRAG